MTEILKDTDLTIFKKLPRNIRYGLISLETEELIKQIAEKYNLKTPEKIGSISVLVRNFLAGQLNEDSLKKEIYQRFQLNNTISLDFLVDFKKIVEEVKKIGLQEVKKDLVVLRFSDLLEKIPAVKKQEIGIYDIFFPKEDIEREPTIENWITDYKLRKNDQQETAILNVSDYLYNNKNTQDLNQTEKEQLSIVLRAYEGNQIIYYNKLFQEIDFEIIKLLNKNKKNKESFNIRGFTSKPYHDTDGQQKEVSEEINFKPKPIERVDFSQKEKKSTSDNQNQKVLNLSKYV